MEQHPVPQHIASFEFKLFGNLTVRQFVTLSIPMGFAALVFFSALPAIIRLPFSIVIGLFALFAALVPINGRPLDKWFISFIKAVLSPTQRVWVKEARLPEFLNVVIAPSPVDENIPETITVQGRERLKAYLRSLPKGTVTPFDVKEEIAIQRLGLEVQSTSQGTLLQGKLPPPIIWPTASSGKTPFFTSASLPQVQTGHQLSSSQIPVTPIQQEYETGLEASLPKTASVPVQASPRIAPHAKPFALPGLERKLKKEEDRQPGILELTPREPLVKAKLASEANAAVENVISIKTPGRQIRLIHGIGQTRVRKLHFAPPEGFDLSKLPIRGEKRFEISQELKNRFSPADLFKEEPSPAPEVVLPVSQPAQRANPQLPTQPAFNTDFKKTQSVPKQTRAIPKTAEPVSHQPNLSLKQEKREVVDSTISISSQKSGDLPLPQSVSKAQIVPLTNTPNVISGIITNKEGVPVNGAIVTLKDANSIPVRALKTNKLGQFLSATPLQNGNYSLEVEAETEKFAGLSLTLNGQVIQPLEIKSN